MNLLPSDIFIRQLRIERERQKISQAELGRRVADTLGTPLDPSAITRIEQQIRAVRLDEAVAIAQALGVPLQMLLTDGEDQAVLAEAIEQDYLARLVQAQHDWEQQRLEIGRLARIVQSLGGGYDLYREDVMRPAGQRIVDRAALDPDLAKDIQSRAPENREQFRPEA